MLQSTRNYPAINRRVSGGLYTYQQQKMKMIMNDKDACVESITSFEKEQGRPYVDVENGLFHRTWLGENVPANKRAPVQRIPARLLAHLRRWRRLGTRYVCEYQGRAADPKKAFGRFARAVFPDTDMKVVRHTFRHTAATWLMQRRADKFEAADIWE
ncbi:hypothetical protein [Bradyrhizobium sp. JR3.5]